MQIAIDSAKRAYDIDLVNEIDRIKKDMDITEHGYPLFWKMIRRDFNQNRINSFLICPMNYIYHWKADKFRSKEATIPFSDFFIPHHQKAVKHSCLKVERWIEKYSIKLNEFYSYDEDNWESSDGYLVQRNDFEDLVNDIRTMGLSKNQLSLISFLINRAFVCSSGVKGNIDKMDSRTKKNKCLLLKTLYSVNKDLFFQCFVKKELHS